MPCTPCDVKKKIEPNRTKTAVIGLKSKPTEVGQGECGTYSTLTTTITYDNYIYELCSHHLFLPKKIL